MGAQGGGTFSGVAMLGGDSFCVDDFLGMEDPHGNVVSQYISDPMPQGNSWIAPYFLLDYSTYS